MSVPLLHELDGWLADRESRVAGLKPGCAAGVVWAHPGAYEPTPVSLVYLHGYTATRGEVYPVPDRVAADLGANLFYARLTGHGCGFDGHRTATAEDWVRDAVEALEIGRRLGRRVVLMGTSTGGALAAWVTHGPRGLAADALVLVSPNLTPRNHQTELLLWPGREFLLRLLVGPSVGFTPKNELNARFWDHSHHSHSLIPMMDLVKWSRRLDFSQWRVPTLVVTDAMDEVVDTPVTRRLFRRAPGGLVTQVDWTTAEGDHNHVLAGDILSPGGTDRMIGLLEDFLRRTLRGIGG